MSSAFEKLEQHMLEIPRAALARNEINTTCGSAPPSSRGAGSCRRVDFAHHKSTTGDFYP
jgi:hypothetical protein